MIVIILTNILVITKSEEDLGCDSKDLGGYVLKTQ